MVGDRRDDDEPEAEDEAAAGDEPEAGDKARVTKRATVDGKRKVEGLHSVERMGKSSKRTRKVQQSDIGSDDDDYIEHQLPNVDNEKYGIEDNDTSDDNNGEDDEDEHDSEMDVMNLEDEEDVSGNEDGDTTGEDEDEDNEQDDDDDGIDKKIEDTNHADMEELEKEYNELRHEEQDLFRNIRRDQGEDLLKGQAVKSQRALWDKTLEFRFLLQKSFSNSNRLPQEPIRSAFCSSGEGVEEAYSDLIDSTKKTLDSILKLQEALIEKNPSIMEAAEEGDAAQDSRSLDASKNSVEGDEEWFQISRMQSRMASFRDSSVDKWQRKTQVTSGAAGIKNKFQAFNQNISEQVASYMRDPSRMIKGMQQRTSVVPVFGNVHDSTLNKDEVINADGDPELLDDSEFYQQLLREFFETVDAGSSGKQSEYLSFWIVTVRAIGFFVPFLCLTSGLTLGWFQVLMFSFVWPYSETAFYALKRLQTKKRKIVDRRASKSRKIRYHVHEKIVNFMAPEPMNIPSMAPKLFENLFGLKTQKPAAVSSY
ncbi:hypothetical protein OSB04_008324 [Centaurea solstitialis]|uniref:AATF leucine zipper-containing domain-containing protein n=1 Tax=Centaurea solstitialis TaxID=347529 RepID=A0AA38WT33_9ASTR|nr:hypothetical protein OSB04_008324 [Centaurea solstitialis]